jgi:hypothetical protein
MRLEKILSLKDSLSVRLTLWYALIFTVSSFLVLLIFYERISFKTIRNTDQDISEEMNEFSQVYKRDGTLGVKQGMSLEASSEGADGVFFRLISEKGELLACSDMDSWGRMDISLDHVRRALTERKPAFQTMTIPGHEYDVRSAYSLIGPSMIMQIGISDRKSVV